MQLHNKTMECWVCGPQNPAGLNVRFEPFGQNGSEARYTVTRRLLHPASSPILVTHRSHPCLHPQNTSPKGRSIGLTNSSTATNNSSSPSDDSNNSPSARADTGT